MKLKFYAKWIDGKFNWLSPEWVKEKMDALPDCNLIITMEEDRGKRTNPQNAYYWKIIVPMIKDGLRELGWNEIKTDQQAHDFLKNKFLLQKVVNENTGEVLEIPRSTTDLNTKEFNEYYEEIWQWGAEFLSITIPEPNTQSKLFAVKN